MDNCAGQNNKKVILHNTRVNEMTIHSISFVWFYSHYRLFITKICFTYVLGFLCWLLDIFVLKKSNWHSWWWDIHMRISIKYSPAQSTSNKTSEHQELDKLDKATQVTRVLLLTNRTPSVVASCETRVYSPVNKSERWRQKQTSSKSACWNLKKLWRLHKCLLVNWTTYIHFL